MGVGEQLLSIPFPIRITETVLTENHHQNIRYDRDCEAGTSHPSGAVTNQPQHINNLIKHTDQIMNNEKISQQKTAGYRKALLIQQDYLCGLCSHHIDYEKAVLDHDHATGRIRTVLHRSCNSLLGKVENNYRRFGVTLDQLQVIAPTVYEYIRRDYTQNPFHYTYKKKKCTPNQN